MEICMSDSPGSVKFALPGPARPARPVQRFAVHVALRGRGRGLAHLPKQVAREPCSAR